jgi:hypothetical protein
MTASQGLEGGERNPDSELVGGRHANTGAFVMGRAMFDAGEEPWGDTPPFGTHALRVITRRS